MFKEIITKIRSYLLFYNHKICDFAFSGPGQFIIQGILFKVWWESYVSVWIDASVNN